MGYKTEQQLERAELKWFTLEQLRRAGARRISFEHCIYDADKHVSRGIQIPLAVLDKAGNVILAIRFRMPATPAKDRKRKTRPKRDKTESKRTQLINKITGCQVIVIRSMSDAVKLPIILQDLNISLH